MDWCDAERYSNDVAELQDEEAEELDICEEERGEGRTSTAGKAKENYHNDDDYDDEEEEKDVKKANYHLMLQTLLIVLRTYIRIKKRRSKYTTYTTHTRMTNCH